MTNIIKKFFYGFFAFNIYINIALAKESCPQSLSYQCQGGEAYCGKILPFDPKKGLGYWDYPLNGESETNQYRSYARRDLIQLVKYAAASTNCIAQNWPEGNGEPLGLGDMSEKTGDIPGTSDGRPGHPKGTHVNGYDMDLAYFQMESRDNKLRAVCKHKVNGKDKYHCIEKPHQLDLYRTAFFIAKLHDNSRLRVVGVDGTIGPLLHEAFDELCKEGIVTNMVCNKNQRALAYETKNNGRGWFKFHHHHFHISLRKASSAKLPSLQSIESSEGFDFDFNDTFNRDRENLVPIIH